MTYVASPSRYDGMKYNRCGRSGIRLPALSLGLWHNFGGGDAYEDARSMVRRAFDLGITHFDLANNYGPPPGSAEETLGRILRDDLRAHRDELILSNKAGWEMWPGPYGNWGSRKYLVASLDQSLNRMGVDYVDVFYHHRPDPETPIEESMGALDYIVRSGRALYAGISSYRLPEAEKAIQVLRSLGTPCLIHQPRYHMFDRWIEDGLLDALSREGVGCIVFSPLAQGLLTDRYLTGDIPPGSRASRPSSLTPATVQEKLPRVRRLAEIARRRGQSLSQMAIAWVLRHEAVTSALVGASRVAHIDDAVQSLDAAPFSAEELKSIDAALQ
jgi:L-glyceraldehyde 3-phosphate reductase